MASDDFESRMMLDTNLDPPRVEVFYTELTPARAQVYVQLDGVSAADGYQLAGTIYGPINQISQTLAAQSRLRDLGPGHTLLARGVVTDPVFWSHDTPALYRVRFEIKRSEAIVATGQRWLAFRGIGLRDKDLLRDGKRWVLRAVGYKSAKASDWSSWRLCGADCLVDTGLSPSEVQAAAENGVLLVTELDIGASLAEQLQMLAAQPAVGIVILPESMWSEMTGALRSSARNVLLAQSIARQESYQTQSYADLVLVDVDDPATIPLRLGSCNRPVICRRPLADPLPLDLARTECDRLQRDLAPYGQFAGYIV